MGDEHAAVRLEVLLVKQLAERGDLEGLRIRADIDGLRARAYTGDRTAAERWLASLLHVWGSRTLHALLTSGNPRPAVARGKVV